jgi:hypothetical protein
MGRIVAIVLVIFLALILIGQCSGGGDDTGGPEALPVTDDFDSPTLPPTNEGEPFSIPSDSRASYRLLKWSRLPNGHLEALTRRDGPSGTSFERHEIDCEAMTYRELGEGDSKEEALKDVPNMGHMAELTPESISSYTADLVCAKAGR